MAAFELTKEYLLAIEEAIENRNTEYLTAELEEHFPADIAAILYEVNGEQAHYLLQLLDTEKGAEVLSNIEKEDLKKFIKEQFTVEEISTYVNLFDSPFLDILTEKHTTQLKETYLFYYLII